MGMQELANVLGHPYLATRTGIRRRVCSSGSVPWSKSGALIATCITKCTATESYSRGKVMKSARKAHISAYMIDLVPSVRDALCDPSSLVRGAAAQAFRTLYRNVGLKAIEDVV
jgi:hypothetical protein